MINVPGVYNISSEEYHADPCEVPSLSRSIMKDLIYRSAQHAWLHHPRLNPSIVPQENVEKFDIGQVAHALLLEGSDCAALIDGDDWRKKEAREARDKARQNGKIPLLLDQYERVIAMVQVAERAIFNCDELQIGSLKLQGDSEQSYIWCEEDTWLRVRPDWISHDRKLIIDYKTTAVSANPNDLARYIITMGYPLQAAFYSRGVMAVEGTEPKFLFLVQETIEPYLYSFVGLSPELIEMGKQQVEYGIFLWRECMRLNQWPGYPNRVCYIDAPPWALVAWESRASEIGGIV